MKITVLSKQGCKIEYKNEFGNQYEARFGFGGIAYMYKLNYKTSIYEPFGTTEIKSMPMPLLKIFKEICGL